MVAQWTRCDMQKGPLSPRNAQYTAVRGTVSQNFKSVRHSVKNYGNCALPHSRSITDLQQTRHVSRCIAGVCQGPFPLSVCGCESIIDGDVIWVQDQFNSAVTSQTQTLSVHSTVEIIITHKASTQLLTQSLSWNVAQRSTHTLR